MPTGTANVSVDFSLYSISFRVPASGSLGYTLDFTPNIEGFVPVKGNANVSFGFTASAETAVTISDPIINVVLPFEVSSTGLNKVSGSLNSSINFTSSSEVDDSLFGSISGALDFSLDSLANAHVEGIGTNSFDFSANSSGIAYIEGVLNQTFEIKIDTGIYVVTAGSGAVPLNIALNSIAINDSTRVYSRVGQNNLHFRNNGSNEVTIPLSYNDTYLSVDGTNGVEIIDDNNPEKINTYVNVLPRKEKNAAVITSSAKTMIKA